jgi:glycosyltransferase involved in cell wall biosynthesis
MRLLVVVSKFGPYIDEIPGHVKVTYLFKSEPLVRVLAWLHRKFGLTRLFKNKMARLQDQYDLAISFLDSNFTDLLLFLENANRRVAFIHSSYKTNENFYRFYKKIRYRDNLKKYRYNSLDGIYFVSDDSMSEFVDIFGEFPEMGVIYNMINRSSVLEKADRAADTVDDVTFTFAAVGSLLPVKGFDRLIRAAKIVQDRGHNFRIDIVGSGSEEQKLTGMTRKYNLENRIRFHGFLSNPYPVMKNSDVFVMSSVSEALPTVLCEAMILGLPTLVTNCSGCRGLVDNGEYGLMAEQDDHDLAEKMILYIENPELLKKYRKKSLERAELFDDERVLQAYYDIFDGKVMTNT